MSSGFATFHNGLSAIVPARKGWSGPGLISSRDLDALPMRTCVKRQESVNHIELRSMALAKGNHIRSGRPIIDLNLQELIRHNTF